MRDASRSPFKKRVALSSPERPIIQTFEPGIPPKIEIETLQESPREYRAVTQVTYQRAWRLHALNLI
jgi:hypothetical protein